MDSSTLIFIHTVSVMIFLLTYVIKTILLFSSKSLLGKYSSFTKVPEMILSFLFLVSGVWLFIIIGGIKYMQIIKLIFVLAAIPIAVVGFKKHNKGLALFSLMLIIGAYGISEMSKNKNFIPKTTAALTADNLTTSNGALIFHQNCVFCHGEDGKKMYRNAPDLSLSYLSEDAIIQSVREGSKGKMPPYQHILSDENIEAVSKFVTSLHPIRN